MSFFKTKLEIYPIKFCQIEYLCNTKVVATLTFKDPVPPFPYWGKYINPSQIDFCAELRPDPTMKQ